MQRLCSARQHRRKQARCTRGSNKAKHKKKSCASASTVSQRTLVVGALMRKPGHVSVSASSSRPAADRASKTRRQLSRPALNNRSGVPGAAGPGANAKLVMASSCKSRVARRCTVCFPTRQSHTAITWFLYPSAAVVPSAENATAVQGALGSPRAQSKEVMTWNRHAGLNERA